MFYYTCPICGHSYTPEDYSKQWAEKNTCRIVGDTNTDFLELYCCCFQVTFFLHKDLWCMADEDLREKLLNLIAEHITHNNICEVDGARRLWYFYLDENGNGIYGRYPNYINLVKQLKNYPTQTLDIAHRTLVNYSCKYPKYGEKIVPFHNENRLSFQTMKTFDHNGVMDLLVDLGYVKDPSNDGCYTITAAGWQKIDELREKEQIVQQGFIAMSFCKETKPIREAFRKAMQESGYSAAVIDEKEHNNQIVPEIFYEIERSKFVVVDVTYPNYGAYYEAGYAQALGKQVIICCREAEFHDKSTRPHFDISQKSMVVWKDEADLIQRLKRRIEATVK